MKKNTITSNALLLLLCLGLLMMSSCRKDLETDLPGNSYSNVSATPSRERIALLRQSFDGLKNRPSLTGNNAVDFYASLTPLWNSARYMPHTNDSVIYMPLLDPSLLADPYTEIFLTIRDRPSEDEYGLIVFNMDSAYYAGSGITPTLENFTGVVYQVTSSGLLRHFNTFSSGRVVKYCEQISDAQHGTGIHVRDETEDCLDGIFGPDCWDPNKGAFWRGVGGFFKGIWAGIIDIVGSQPGDPSGWMGTWFIGGYNVYFDPSDNTPGGGINTNNPNTPPASTWQYLNEVLDGVLFKKAARMAQKLCDQYDLKLPQESFWDIFAAAGIDFIYANEDWTPQKNFNEIALFENAFRELIYLKAINYPLSTPDNSTTSAYVWLKAHPEDMTIMSDMLVEDDSPESINALKVSLEIALGDKLYGSFDQDYFDIINHHSTYQIPGPLTEKYISYLTAECVRLKLENPGWSDKHIIWEATKASLQLGLDILGLIPVFGEVADLTNGLIYAVSGDATSAGLSILAAVPFAGWPATGTKWAMKVVTAAGRRTTLKWVKIGDVITFGDRRQLRRMMGLVKGDSRVAHHIIPWGKSGHPLVQKASAGGTSSFHMNEALNGIPLTSVQHSGSHSTYTNKVTAKMNKLLDEIGVNASPEEAQVAIIGLTNQIRAWIVAHPNTNIDNIVL